MKKIFITLSLFFTTNNFAVKNSVFDLEAHCKNYFLEQKNKNSEFSFTAILSTVEKRQEQTLPHQFGTIVHSNIIWSVLKKANLEKKMIQDLEKIDNKDNIYEKLLAFAVTTADEVKKTCSEKLIAECEQTGIQEVVNELKKYDKND